MVPIVHARANIDKAIAAIAALESLFETASLAAGLAESKWRHAETARDYSPQSPSSRQTLARARL